MTPPREVLDQLSASVVGDRFTRWSWRLLVALVAFLVVVNVARADVRPATAAERWAVDDAAQLLRSKGVSVPEYTVSVDTTGETMPVVGGMLAAAAYAQPGRIVLSVESARDAADVMAASKRPRRYRATAYANAPVYQAVELGLHEVAHLAQFHYGSWSGCALGEGVAEAVAYDWAGTLIRRRWGRVEILESLAYVDQLELVLAQTGESQDLPTSYAGRAVRLDTLRGTVPCPDRVAARTSVAAANQRIARRVLAPRGWHTGRQWVCVRTLWQRESGWDHRARNPRSGATGIPQALPGSKMRSAGPDWRTNPATQIRWGAGYVAARYGTPCNALAHSNRVGWY